ncbi:MAG: hypothetical protein U0229_17295 [Anaeromyxobacter sp.]
MIAALALAATLAAPAGQEGSSLEPVGVPARRLSRGVVAGPWVGTFHGLTVKGLEARGSLQLNALRIRLTEDAVVSFAPEAELVASVGRTPNGLGIGDTMFALSAVLGEGPVRAVVGGEGGVLWLERATTGSLHAYPVVGPRAAIRLDVPVRWAGAKLRVELAARVTAEHWVRGGVLVGLAR